MQRWDRGNVRGDRMRLLLDTYILLWLITDSPRVQEIKPVVEHFINDVYFSSASVWEIAIKNRLGKLPVAPEQAKDEFLRAGFSELMISSDHAIAVNRLADPDTENKDPFDRILIAQAKTEQMRLITADEKIAVYPEPCIWKI